MAPAFWTRFVKLFRKSTPQDVDPHSSAQDSDLSARGDPTPLEVCSLLRRVKEDYFLIADTLKSTSLSDAALINATAAMRLLVAKFKQYVDWVKQNPRQAILIVACIIIPIVFTAATPTILDAIGFSSAGPVVGM
jgi:hypothetical protein